MKKVVTKLKDILNNNLFKEFSFYSIATVIYQFVRVVVELIVAKILGPSLWGIWYFLNLVIAYRGIAHLGVVNSINRDVPINLGKGDSEKAKLIENVAFSSLFISTLVSTLALALITVFTIHDPDVKKAIFWLIPLFFAAQLFYLVEGSLKAYSKFIEVGKKQLIFSVVFPMSAITLAYYFSLNGFIVGFTIALTVSTLVVYLKSNLRYSFIMDTGILKYLIKVGFPIMAVGITYTLLNTADRWIIGIILGTEYLGYYSLAIMVLGTMSIIPRLVSQQLYPRMAFDWGETNLKERLVYWSRKQTRYTTYLVVPLFLGVFFIFPWVIDTWLPDYRLGINPLKIIIFGPLFMPLSAGWGNVLNIIDKQVYYLGIIIIAVLINLILNYFLVVNGYGIDGVALGTAVTFALYNIAIMMTGKICLKSYR